MHSTILLALTLVIACSVVFGGQCGSSARRQACRLVRMSNLRLRTGHPSRVRDNAYPSSNLQDMCAGRKARRSSYSCRECRSGAPGGTVCIGTQVMNYLEALARRGGLTVTSIAGACHSCSSRHYRGRAVDLRLWDTNRASEFERTCRRNGGFALNEGTHFHCQF